MQTDLRQGNTFARLLFHIGEKWFYYIPANFIAIKCIELEGSFGFLSLIFIEKFGHAFLRIASRKILIIIYRGEMRERNEREISILLSNTIQNTYFVCRVSVRCGKYWSTWWILILRLFPYCTPDIFLLYLDCVCYFCSAFFIAICCVWDILGILKKSINNYNFLAIFTLNKKRRKEEIKF